MKVFYCDEFTGHYPVGTAAIIVAKTIKEAAQQLMIELANRGLEQSIDVEQLTEVKPNQPGATPFALILCDGDY